MDPEGTVTFERRTMFYVQYICDVSCHSFFFSFITLIFGFHTLSWLEPLYVFSLIISSCMQNSTNEESFFRKKRNKSWYSKSCLSLGILNHVLYTEWIEGMNAKIRLET